MTLFLRDYMQRITPSSVTDHICFHKDNVLPQGANNKIYRDLHGTRGTKKCLKKTSQLSQIYSTCLSNHLVGNWSETCTISSIGTARQPV